MKKSLMFILFTFCMAWAGQAAASGIEKVKGSWDYKVPSAPYEYSKGKLIFAEKDGQAAVSVKFTNGTEVKAKNVKIEKDSISFGVEIDYNLVTFTGKLENNKIAGKVNTPEGPMEVTAERSR